MNIPTKVFVETPMMDFDPEVKHNASTMFSYMTQILINMLEDGGGGWANKFTLEDISNSNVRLSDAEEAKKAMSPIFEWEMTDSFMAHCETLGYDFGDQEPEDTIDWGVVLVLLNEIMADLPERVRKAARLELAFIDKEKQEYRSYYLNMPIEARKIAVNQQLTELRKKMTELKSFIQ